MDARGSKEVEDDSDYSMITGPYHVLVHSGCTTMLMLRGVSGAAAAEGEGGGDGRAGQQARGAPGAHAARQRHLAGPHRAGAQPLLTVNSSCVTSTGTHPAAAPSKCPCHLHCQPRAAYMPMLCWCLPTECALPVPSWSCQGTAIPVACRHMS